MFQIRIRPDGKWHRRKMGGEDNLTACGEPVSSFMSRDWQLDADLCDVCFTKNERDTGEFKRLERVIPNVDLFDDAWQTTEPIADHLIAELEKMKPT